MKRPARRQPAQPTLPPFYEEERARHKARHGQDSEPEWLCYFTGQTGEGDKKSKYGNRITKTKEGSFASKREHERWCELRLMERAKEITNLRRQVRYRLESGGTYFGLYIADAVYFDAKTGKEIVEDSKGCLTATYLKARRLMLEIHGIEILET